MMFPVFQYKLRGKIKQTISKDKAFSLDFFSNENGDEP